MPIIRKGIVGNGISGGSSDVRGRRSRHKSEDCQAEATREDDQRFSEIHVPLQFRRFRVCRDAPVEALSPRKSRAVRIRRLISRSGACATRLRSRLTNGCA